MHADKVFKALGDPTRRKLLDFLCEKNGQTLGQLCENLDMARQSATQHLGILEEANLVSTVKRGRGKLPFINTLPRPRKTCARPSRSRTSQGATGATRTPPTGRLDRNGNMSVPTMNGLSKSS